MTGRARVVPAKLRSCHRSVTAGRATIRLRIRRWHFNWYGIGCMPAHEFRRLRVGTYARDREVSDRAKRPRFRRNRSRALGSLAEMRSTPRLDGHS
jgi:hypothetical protein